MVAPVEEGDLDVLRPRQQASRREPAEPASDDHDPVPRLVGHGDPSLLALRLPGQSPGLLWISPPSAMIVVAVI